MDINYICNLLGKLKDLERSGWKNAQISNPEDVAAHSFGVVFLTFLLCPPHLDRDKCIKMAIIHDIQEAFTGDPTPFDNISPAEKNAKETNAIKQISQDLNNLEILKLFQEYEGRETPESRFVKDIDKLDALLQAQYYDQNNRSFSPLLPEFIKHAEKCYQGAYQNDIIKQIYTTLKKHKKQE